MCRVGIRVPTIEVRYENVTVDAKCFVGDRALPTLKNATINCLEVWTISPLNIKASGLPQILLFFINFLDLVSQIYLY